MIVKWVIYMADYAHVGTAYTNMASFEPEKVSRVICQPLKQGT